MTNQGTGSLVALRQKREQAIEMLSDAFADDLLELDEFENRVTLAHQARDVEALVVLTQDLTVPKPEAEPAEALAPVAKPVATKALTKRRKSANLVAIMGGAERSGQWRVPEKLRVVAIMGGADIDLREVDFPPGETHIQVFAMMGGVDILVPPTLAVEADGMGILGGFGAVDRVHGEPDGERPTVRITGVAIMGGVEVHTRLPGESRRQARKRRKKERKQLLESSQKQLKS